MAVFFRLRKAPAPALFTCASSFLLLFSRPGAAWALIHTGKPAFLDSPQSGHNPQKWPHFSSRWGGGGHVTPEGCSNSALGAFGSFFRSRKSAADASPGEPQQERQQQQRHTSADLYRLLGVPPDASPAAVAARAQELQSHLDQLAAEGPAAETAAAPGAAAARGVPVDPLLAGLVREVAETLQDPEKRAAFDRDGLIPPSLSVLLSQLPSPAAAAAQDEHTEGGADLNADAVEEEADEREAGGGGPSDLFSALFGGPLGGGFGGGPLGGPGAMRLRMRPQRGPDVEASVSLGFAAAALNGAPSVPVSVTRLDECDACKGTGGAGGAKPKSCKTCGGRGLQTESKRSAYGIVSTATTCATCGGQGHLPVPRCGSCGGHGRQQCNITIQVSVPPGVADGSTLMVEGAGSAGKNGGPRGDLCVRASARSQLLLLLLLLPIAAASAVSACCCCSCGAAASGANGVLSSSSRVLLPLYACSSSVSRHVYAPCIHRLLTVRVEEDNRFVRKGSDVFTEETISLAEAALGTTRKIETLDGEAELTIPTNSQPGQQLRLKGRGARQLGVAGSPRGDHVVTLRVALPAHISEEERHLLQRLKEIQSSRPPVAAAAGGGAGGAAVASSSRTGRHVIGRQRDRSTGDTSSSSDSTAAAG
ncbi:hypothetical protein ACSSS7_005446 [Eimeria intestinalis]